MSHILCWYNFISLPPSPKSEWVIGLPVLKGKKVVYSAAVRHTVPVKARRAHDAERRY